MVHLCGPSFAEFVWDADCSDSPDALSLCMNSPPIEAAFSSKDGGDMIRCALGDDSRVLIDVINEARSTLAHHHESVG